MASDPKAELRQMLADKLLARFLERARDGVADSPEGHCADLADQVMELFTVEEDYQPIEDRRLDSPTELTIWHRRLVGKTNWQPAGEPPAASEAKDATRRLMAFLRANDIDPDTVLAHPAPAIDHEARTITVHHFAPNDWGFGSWMRTYPMKAMPDAVP